MSQESVTQEDLKQSEERFLADLEQRPLPMAPLMGMLRFLHSSGHGPLAENWAQMLADVLVELGDGAGLMRLLAAWAEWRGGGRGFGGFCRDILKKACKERLWNALVDSAAFGEVAPAESLRRLKLLLACKPGVACLDKTWGFGIVKRLDDFYKRIVIDFTGKPGHALTLAYAGEALSLADDDHLLALRHRDPAALERLVREDAAEVVRLTLRSFGSMTLARLETLLDEHRIVPAADWKRFWEAARKALKDDPLVEVPAKRTLPLTLRSAAPAYDEAWFDALRVERDIDTILARVAALAAALDLRTLDAARQTALAERLAFAVKGAHNSDVVRYARLALLVRRLALDTPSPATLRDHLREEGRYRRAAEGLAARDTAQLVAFLLEDGETAAERLLGDLPAMSYNLLAESLDNLRQGAFAAIAQARCRAMLSATAVPPTLLVWVLRSREVLAAWPLPSIYELVTHALAIIEDPNLCGELLRMQHQLRGLFDNAKWFEAAFGEMSGVQQEAVFDRIQAGSGRWEPLVHRALLGRMLKIVPGLAERKRGGASADSSAGTLRFTSWRSLLERQAQLRQLLDVEIPRNSRDIAAARAYGDLRENFEYHAARHQQGMLMQRRDEWERALRQMRGTDFADVSTERVGMGVQVTLRLEAGGERRYAILGEWDRDEALAIISNRSRLAQVLEGRQVGEAVALPGETGDEPATVAAITPLDAAVRAWVGTPQASAPEAAARPQEMQDDPQRP